MREAGDGVPLGERGDLAPPAVRHRGDELLHRAASAHGPDDEVCVAWDVDRGRRVLRRAAARDRGRRRRGLRERERELGLGGHVVELLLGKRRRPAELLDDAADAAARGAGVGVGRGRGRRGVGDAAGARRDGPDGLDLAPALDERRRARAGGRELGGRRAGGSGGGGRGESRGPGAGGGGGVGGRRRRLPEHGGAGGDGARGGRELVELGLPGAAALVGRGRGGGRRDGRGGRRPSLEDLVASPGRGLAGGGRGGGRRGGGVRGEGGRVLRRRDEDVEEAPGRGRAGRVPPLRGVVRHGGHRRGHGRGLGGRNGTGRKGRGEAGAEPGERPVAGGGRVCGGRYNSAGRGHLLLSRFSRGLNRGEEREGKWKERRGEIGGAAAAKFRRRQRQGEGGEVITPAGPKAVAALRSAAAKRLRGRARWVQVVFSLFRRGHGGTARGRNVRQPWRWCQRGDRAGRATGVPGGWVARVLPPRARRGVPVPRGEYGGRPLSLSRRMYA